MKLYKNIYSESVSQGYVLNYGYVWSYITKHTLLPLTHHWELRNNLLSTPNLTKIESYFFNIKCKRRQNLSFLVWGSSSLIDDEFIHH